MDYIKHLISQGNLSEALEYCLLLNPEDDDAVVPFHNKPKPNWNV